MQLGIFSEKNGVAYKGPVQSLLASFYPLSLPRRVCKQTRRFVSILFHLLAATSLYISINPHCRCAGSTTTKSRPSIAVFYIRKKSVPGGCIQTYLFCIRRQEKNRSCLFFFHICIADNIVRGGKVMNDKIFREYLNYKVNLARVAERPRLEEELLNEHVKSPPPTMDR